ncbi:MAG: peptidoglycan DD-metalloendopeptidase family protein [Candidatus Tectomicrobia bacterium]|uniref:Peptidoglycan DD-metalloendopeptidase family protein n=1 Tax=Tectimicrobiota bacterium TaxID=2528274 RepID=A0A932CLW2_UNCTE|nr:peptidoglycan DD-metalloendopeptidase family protein [Candidatus Tectomicrobia bacterium]
MATESSWGPSSSPLRDLTSRAEGWETRLEALRRESVQGDPQAREKVAREFEALFIHYLFKVMRETVPQGGLLGDGQEEAFYTSMLDQELARRMADRGGLGLADLIRQGTLEESARRPPDAAGQPEAHSQPSAAEEPRPTGLAPLPSPSQEPSPIPLAGTGKAVRERPLGGPLSPPEGAPSHSLRPSAALPGVSSSYRVGPPPASPGESLSLQRTPPPLQGQGLHGLQWPLEGRISSPFGPRQDPLTGQTRSHQGIDLVSATGSEIRAAAPGEVIFSGDKGGYGKTVILQHGGYQTLYAHNLANLVRVGDKVQAGQPIALLGDSGRSTGPHLHFEVRREGEAVNPRLLLQADNER